MSNRKKGAGPTVLTRLYGRTEEDGVRVREGGGAEVARQSCCTGGGQHSSPWGHKKRHSCTLMHGCLCAADARVCVGFSGFLPAQPPSIQHRHTMVAHLRSTPTLIRPSALSYNRCRNEQDGERVEIERKHEDQHTRAYTHTDRGESSYEANPQTHAGIPGREFKRKG